MKIQAVHREFLYGLNKLGTNANQSVGIPQFVSLINKAQIQWAESFFPSKEINQVVSDRLNPLLVEEAPNLSFKDNRYTFPIPENYFHWSKFHAYTKECDSVVYGRFVEEGNINKLIQGAFTKPSAAWEEVLCTIFGNRVRVYVDGFSISRPNFSYYRLPAEVDMAGYTKEDGSVSFDIDLEFEGQNAYEIIDMAVRICAGNTGDIQRLLTSQK